MLYLSQLRWGLMAIIIVAPWLSHCGKEAQFKGDNSKGQHSDNVEVKPLATTPDERQQTILPPPQNPSTNPATPVEPTPNDLGLTWQWPCMDSAAGSDTADQEGKLIGPGPHRLNWDDNNRRLNLHVEGQLCPPKARPRDVVFAIDISGSMETNDPAVAGKIGCARFDAMVKTIAALPNDGSLRIGLVLFDHQLYAQSSGLFSGLAALRQHMENKYRYTLESLVCARLVDTRFDVALTGVQNIFNMSSNNQNAKELFLITDGQPDAGQNASAADQEKAKGLKEAQALKDSGVVIATVMLGSVSDEHLKTLGSGPSYHAVAAKASELAPTLAALAENRVQSGTLTFYTLPSDSKGSGDENDPAAKVILQQDLLKVLRSDLSFAVDVTKLQRRDLQKDLYFSYSYRDRLQTETRASGMVNWE